MKREATGKLPVMAIIAVTGEEEAKQKQREEEESGACVRIADVQTSEGMETPQRGATCLVKRKDNCVR
ncbi:hypothetical protein KKD52_05700 [Myxococcota bacterium]|nr:hypothetical protein [Myxococcota bacterium]MBU1410614.1 hypothetical protein [Myxococcota bacterium]MBU1509835.1 hypothetical protein [Myxococcota bacterium]